MQLPSKITPLEIRSFKTSGKKISALTCYDYTFAKLLDGKIEMLLVGDSLGMVMQGHTTTIPVTLDQMVYHTQCVSKALKQSHLIADMPFLSYQLGEDEALRNAGRLIAEGGAESVKLEGGEVIANKVKRITEAGIPVVGHLGLLPQSVHQAGGYKVQGRLEADKEKLLNDAKCLEQAGAFALVLELIPWPLARRVSESISIPTIGIGAGPFCDGQILVLQDFLGMNENFKPRFLRRFESLGQKVQDAAERYKKEINESGFPSLDESFE